MVWYGKCDLYSAIITTVSNALNTLVSGEKPGFQALSKGCSVVYFTFYTSAICTVLNSIACFSVNTQYSMLAFAAERRATRILLVIPTMHLKRRLPMSIMQNSGFSMRILFFLFNEFSSLFNSNAVTQAQAVPTFKRVTILHCGEKVNCE